MQKKSTTLLYFTQIFIVFTFFLVLPQISVSSYVHSTITSKFIYFLYGCSILLFFYIFYFVSAKTISFSFTKLDLALFLLINYIFLNRYIIQSDFGFSIRYMELVGLSFLYVFLRRLSPRNYPWLLLVIVISGIFQAIYGNLQLFGYCPSNYSRFKMTGSFFNPGPYAGFLVSVWSVTLGMYLFKDQLISQIQSHTKKDALFLNELIKWVFKYIPLLGLISIAVVLPATHSRASWIAAVSCSLILLELRYVFFKKLLKKMNRFKRIILITLLIVILSTALYGIYYSKKKSSDGRLFIWKVTTEMITEAPLFGVGFDRFKANYMNFQAQYFAINGETQEAMVADNTYYAFNEGLQFVAENGFLGFLLLTFVGLVLFQIRVKQIHKFDALIAKTGLLTIVVFACFSYPMQILPIKLVLVALVAMLSNTTPDTFQLKIRENKKTQCVYKIIALLFGGFCMYQTIFFTKNLSKGFISWNKALNSEHQYGDYQEAITEFKTAYPIFKKHGLFLTNYGKTLAMAGEPYKAIAVLEEAKPYLNNIVIATTLGDSYKATQQYHKAEAAYQQAINMIPSKFYANYLLAKLYDDFGQERKASVMAEKIMSKKIKISSMAITEIREEMKKILVKYGKPPVSKN